MARTNLKMSNLRRAITGATSGQFKLAADGRGSATQTSMRNEFAVDSFDGVTGNTSLGLGGEDETYTMSMTNQGTLYTTKIGNRSANGTWSSSNSGRLAVSVAYGSSAVYTIVDIGVVNVEGKVTDYYNINATNYDTTDALEVTIT